MAFSRRQKWALEMLSDRLKLDLNILNSFKEALPTPEERLHKLKIHGKLFVEGLSTRIKEQIPDAGRLTTTDLLDKAMDFEESIREAAYTWAA